MDDKTKKIMKTLGFREDYDPDNRVVKQEDVTVGDVTYHVSTVDLGIDHSFLEGESLFYETMIFVRKEDGEINFTDHYVDRYPTKPEAIVGHSWVVNKLKKGEFTLGEYGYINFD